MSSRYASLNLVWCKRCRLPNWQNFTTTA